MVAVTAWPVERVRAALPPGVVPGLGTDVHPVVLLFGVQANGATHLAGVRIPLARPYRELAVAVPEVREHDEPATALVRMYADYFPAVWNGRMRYGFGKEHADIRRSDTSFVVAHPGGAPVCAAVHEPSGEWSTALRPPALRDVARWLSGTLVGWTPGGRRVRTASFWDVDGRPVRSVRASVRAFEPILPGGVAGELLEEPVAAFEVEGVRWALGWPEPDGGALD